MNELKIFENEKFGEIRIVEVNGKTNFIAIDVAKALKYQNTIDILPMPEDRGF